MADAGKLGWNARGIGDRAYLALIAILGGPVRVEFGKTVSFFWGTDWEVALNEMPARVDKLDNIGAGLGEVQG